ncbi:LysE family translocator [Cupriavidus sp. 30B13]|uniref:LysE family translocator n=1 Tax=Cupriavidus sp. 30B13 TaxID=3384241 RepID=UPI003B9207CA
MAVPQLVAGSGVFAAFCVFALVSSITPGPNNTMVLASGVNFGFARTVPHILGISLGFALMVAVVGLGLGSLFAALPWTWTVLRVVAALYLAWLAWQLATSGGMQERQAARPMGFLRAAAFQWVNPKAWVMAVGACSTYVLHGNVWLNVLLLAGVFAVINLPSVAMWAVFGSALRRWLAQPRVLRVFNVAMALLLLASLWPIVSARP